MEKNTIDARVKVHEDPLIKDVELEKIGDLVFKVQVLDPSYCSTLCNEIKRICSTHPTLRDVRHIDTHQMGLDQVATKIFKALLPSLNKHDLFDLGKFEIKSSYITVTNAARPSHRRFLQNPAHMIIDLNLGDEFTGGELLWLKPGGYSHLIEAQEKQTVGKALIWRGTKLQGARAVTEGERINIVIELQKVHSFMPFNDLTPEVKRYWFKFLQVSDLCMLCQTCHDMKTMTYGAESEWTMPLVGAKNRDAIAAWYKFTKLSTKDINVSTDKVVAILQEFSTTEQQYADNLRYLNEHLPVFAGIPKLEVKFGAARVALQRLAEVHSKVAEDLRLIRIGQLNQDVFSLISLLTVFSSVIGAFSCYADYVSHYQTILDVLELTDKAIVKFKQEFDAAADNTKGIRLEGYLVMLVSRLPRYTLLFFQMKNVFSRYKDLDAEAKMLDAVMNMIREASNVLNQIHSAPYDAKQYKEEVAKIIKKSRSCVVS